jgi:hypothetical protein
MGIFVSVGAFDRNPLVHQAVVERERVLEKKFSRFFLTRKQDRRQSPAVTSHPGPQWRVHRETVRGTP